MTNFIKKIVVLTVALTLFVSSALVIQNRIALASSFEKQCYQCENQDMEKYTEADFEQKNKIFDIILNSEKSDLLMLTENNVSLKDYDSVKVLVHEDNPDLGFVLAKNTDKRTLSIYGVDQTRKVVFGHADFSFEQINEDEQILTISSPQKNQKFKMTSDGKLFDLTNNKEIKVDEIESLTSLEPTNNSADKSSNLVTTQSSCRDYVGTMCGLMSGYGMAELCALAALAGGLPGVGCAVVYAAIATWGCTSAMDLFC